MTIQHDEQSTTRRSSGSTVERAENKAAEAAGTAIEEGKQVASTAKEQFHQLVGEAKRDVSDKGETIAQRAAERLRDLDRQASSLLEGRGGGGGQLEGYLREGQQRVQSLADRLEQGGAQGVIDDLVQYGRRRPGTFLLAAAGLGFLTARVVRVGASQSGDQQQWSSGSMSSGMPRGGSALGMPDPIMGTTGPMSDPTYDTSVGSGIGGAVGTGLGDPTYESTIGTGSGTGSTGSTGTRSR